MSHVIVSSDELADAVAGAVADATVPHLELAEAVSLLDSVIGAVQVRRHGTAPAVLREIVEAWLKSHNLEDLT